MSEQQINPGQLPCPVCRPGPPTRHPNRRRLRRLHRVWPDRDGNISYLLTLCVDGRARVLDNGDIFQRLVDFLIDSPQRYHWFGRRFVIMPDHIHLIAHQGNGAVPLGQWVKALKAVGRVPSRGGVGPVPSRGGVGPVPSRGGVGPVPSRGDDRGDSVGPVPSPGFRSWRWQAGFHDHKFRTRESESRKWEYICLNPVRAGLVLRPEEWPYGGEILYEDEPPRLIRGTPPLLETGTFIEEGGTVGRVPPHGSQSQSVGHKPPHGVSDVGRVPPRGADVGRVPSRGVSDVGRVPSRGAS
jgi:REP element-mobilizing transposase RayT